MSPEQVIGCQESDPVHAGGTCGASVAAGRKCLAHLRGEERGAYLDALEPGADVDARDVVFTPELLAQLLEAVRDDNDVPILGDACFEGAIFSGVAGFAGVTFSGEAGFVGATFSGDALFRGVTFAGDAEFGGATFARDAVFDRATVSEYLGFGGTTFTRTARFTEAVVHGELAMVAIARRVIAIGMRGRGRLELRLRAAEVDLGFAVLAGPVSVHALQRPIAGIAEAAFADEAGRVPPVRVVSLRLLDAASVTLTDVDLSRCRFAGLHRVDQLVLDGRCEFANGPHGRRWVLAEEQHWRASRAAPPPLYEDPGQEHPEVVGPARLEVLYRQLRKALEDAKNEPGAADFYYGEMEMRRAASRGGDRVLLWLYWLTSGYGLLAGRALMALAVVVATLAVAMQYAGFPGKPVGYLDALLYSLRSAVSVEVKTPALPEQVTRWGQLVRILLRVTGPLFVGLAILAVRNRVKR